MILATLITIYILSIIAMRSVCRLIYKHDLWLAKDCRAGAWWFIPFINTVSAIMCSFYMLVEISSKRNGVLSGFIGKIFNHDLKDRY